MKTRLFLSDALAAAVRLLTGARAQVERREETPSRIYFANHTSNLDFVLLWAVLPKQERRRTRPVAAQDYWSRGGLRSWLARDVFRAVLVERKHVTRTNNPVEQMMAVLSAGESLILFPEGGRQDGPKLGRFKSGLFHLAKQFPDAGLVPVHIENLHRVLPKGEVLAVPMLCRVTFGNPIRLEDGEEKDGFLERAREAVEALA
jgi:1-acyl-sn-glycerol-3-phosphate acyltransferase